MKTDFDLAGRYIAVPTVFNPDFNNFSPINPNQAWSLFFTVGRDDAALGSNPELGGFLSNVLKAIALTVVLGGCFFRFV